VIEHVRPHQVFSMVDPSMREFAGYLPRAVGGSILALEACVLVALQRAVNPSRVFEFGTYLGDATRLLAQNLGAPDGVVYTLDIESTEGIELEEQDAVLADRSVAVRQSFAGLRTKVVQLLGDSYVFDAAPYEGRIEFVFIDGNHALKYAERDTDNALRMAVGEGPAAVIWHDYGNPAYPDLTRYLDSLSERMPLHHVEETMFVMRLQGLTLPERQAP
jgi:Methyltransferase domain